ncbi:hypothetical protein FHS42_002727 [Streptomyces zagrosensis]|uniref:Uncharacterized protein n=1 Tax=Streptomyces zagrosensis TaxID=1042984 RepID=A0A7W9Q8P8_9ACTN|nr:hypothetical protein [Streptomyces zagrosensis]
MAAGRTEISLNARDRTHGCAVTAAPMSRGGSPGPYEGAVDVSDVTHSGRSRGVPGADGAATLGAREAAP